MENNCKLSIIVPVYNVEAYLDQCLNSLVNQSIDSYEIIVVNDGSKDNSQKIIDKYANKYPSLIRSFTKENGGLGSARNYALQYAHGEYIGFVDSDDWVDKNMFQAMYNFAQKENYDIVICDFTEIYDGWGSGWRSKGYRGKTPHQVKCDYLLNSLSPATACNKLIKSTLFQIVTFAEIWYEDIATTPILLSYSENIGYLDIPLYYYRQRETSITHTSMDTRSLDVIKAWDKIIEECKKEYKSEIVYAVYKSIVAFLDFKSEFADEYLDYLKKNYSLFYNNQYIQTETKHNNLENLFHKVLIPKNIHYFWFGGQTKSELILRCIESWKKFAPDFNIIEWNESNCDLNVCSYVKEAYAAKKWAFVADYFRTKIIYEQGGIYVDTDIEFTQNISSVRLSNAFFAFETKSHVHAGMLGAIPNYPLIGEWYDTYKNDHFLNKDGTYSTSNTIVIRLTKLLVKRTDILFNGKTQILDKNIKIYAPNEMTLNMFDGKNIAQHHYDASWWDVKAGVGNYKYEVLKDFFSNNQSCINNCTDESNLSIQNEQLKEQIRQLEQSTCWKITRPLRIIKQLLKPSGGI